MADSRSCNYCGNAFHSSADRCPHCANPGLFPNLFAAEQVDEINALEKRYNSAVAEAISRGAGDSLSAFESALTNSRAVIARSAREVLRLATSDNEIYGTYYNLIGAGLRLPEGNKWDALRAVVDSAMFLNYKEQIRFAALSLDGVGLSPWGECSMTLRSNMIAHRTSVFEENSVLFMKHHNIRIAESDQLPAGYRATWENRIQLCVAKLARRIDSSTRPEEYSAVLLRLGATREQDEFVEVHIWGPMTVRTLEEVTLTQPKSVNRAILKTMRTKLEEANVRLS